MVIDRFDYRLEMAQRERSGGRGPDVCIEAIGMEAHAPGPRFRYEQAKQHGERSSPMLLERLASGELRTAHLATHPMPLDEGPRGYDLFKNRKDGRVRSVFRPDPEIMRIIPCAEGLRMLPEPLVQRC